MITKCPHCDTKFRAPDKSKGKRTKCPKCEQSFDIVEFVSEPVLSSEKTNIGKQKLKTCTSCMATIGRLEKTHVFNNMVVCAECLRRLRGGVGLEMPVVHAQKQTGQKILCFFCGENTAQDEFTCIIHMFKIIETKAGWGGAIMRMNGALTAVSPGKTIYYNKSVEKVPRCEACQTWHELFKRRKSKCFRIVAICGVALGIYQGIRFVISIANDGGFQASSLILIPIMGCVGGVLGLILAAIIVSLTKMGLPTDIKPQSYHKRFQTVKHLASQGWQFGEKPDAHVYDSGRIELMQQRKKQIEMLHIFSKIGYALILIVVVLLVPLRSYMEEEMQALYYAITGLVGVFGILGGAAGLTLGWLKGKWRREVGETELGKS